MNMKKVRQRISSGLELGPPQPLNLCVGRARVEKVSSVDGIDASGMIYNMYDVRMASVDIYRGVTPDALSLALASSNRISSPCFRETHEAAPVAAPCLELGHDGQGGVSPTGTIAK